jgi:hypothetical protein
MALHIFGVFYFVLCRVSLAEYNWVLKVLSHPVAGVVLCLLKVVTKCRWTRLLCIYFLSMLLLEDIIWTSNMNSNLCHCKHFKAFLFFQIKFWTQYCNIISAASSVYVICICLIKYNLGCEVDLSRPSWYSTDYRVYISDGIRVSTCLTGTVILDLV